MRLLEIVPGLYQLPRLFSASPYLVLGDEVAVVDGGLRGSHGSLLAALRQLGRAPEEIGQLIATHCHTDHIGSFARLQGLSSARLAVHQAEADYMEGSAPHPNPFCHPMLSWVTGPLAALSAPPCAPVDRRLEDGDTLALLGGMEVVHTPGHTQGSISLYFPAHGVLVIGDALECRGGHIGLPNPIFTADMALAKQSIRRLAALDFEVLCFSHFPPIRRGAGRMLREFATPLQPT